MHHIVMLQLFMSCCREVFEAFYPLQPLSLSPTVQKNSARLFSPVTLDFTATRNDAIYSEYPLRTLSVHYGGDQH